MEIIIIIGFFIFGFVVLGNIYENWSIKRLHNQTISPNDDNTIYANPKNSSVFSGGEGSSEQNAIVISAPNSLSGTLAEYEYIEAKFGKKNIDWELLEQSQYDNNSMKYDVMDINVKNGNKATIYFNITNFYGKF